jgi:hypothetical protein
MPYNCEPKDDRATRIAAVFTALVPKPVDAGDVSYVPSVPYTAEMHAKSVGRHPEFQAK